MAHITVYWLFGLSIYHMINDQAGDSEKCYPLCLLLKNYSLILFFLWFNRLAQHAARDYQSTKDYIIKSQQINQMKLILKKN